MKKLLSFALFSLFSVFLFAQDRPNIIFIITDDQHRDQFNFIEEGRDANGKALNLTPAIDRLANEGVILDQCYVSTSVCTPSRYNVLSGTYASRAMNQNFLNDIAKYDQANVHWNVDLIPQTNNIARELKKNGYYTGGVGKNHVIAGDNKYKVPRDADPSDPEVKRMLEANQQAQVDAYLANGFDYAASIYKGNLPHSYPLALEDHNLEWIVKGGLDFLDLAAEKEEPFFLYFATTLEHGPDQLGTKSKGNPLVTAAGFLEEPLTVMPPRETLDKRISEAGLAEDRNDVLWLDDGIAALVSKLEEIGELDNTIIFYMDDHGVEGGKGSLYQGGVLTVGFVWGPNYIASGIRSKQMVSNIDFVPTVFDLCDIQPSKDYHMDGKSMKSILTGKEKAIHKSLFFEIGATRAVLMDGMKYIAFRTPPEKLPKLERGGKKATHINDQPGGRGSESPALAKYPNYFDHDQLYNVYKDPNEQENLYAERKDEKVVQKLKKELKKYVNDLPGGFAEFTQE